VPKLKNESTGVKGKSRSRKELSPASNTGKKFTAGKEGQCIA
jgi:hypothetical protein